MPATAKVQLTKSGYEDLVHELDDLREDKLQKAIERVARARDFGDLSENAEYQAARDELTFLEGRVEELEDLLAKAQVIEKNGKSRSVDIGCKVTVKSDGGEEHTYQVVGEWEADPVNKRISHSSPLGEALMGKKPGDTVEFEAPAGKVVYEVKHVA